MTQPADNVTKFLRVTLATTGAVVAGLATADFTYVGVKAEPGSSPTTYSTGSVIADLGAGYYAWTYATPGVACNHGQDIQPVNVNHIVVPVSFSGETESQDLASLYNAVAQPVGGAGTAFAFGATVTLELVIYRYRTVTQAFLGTDLSTAAYNNWKMGIRDTTQAVTRWDCDSGAIDGFLITGDASGNLTITVPESLIGPVYTTWTTVRPYAKGDYVRPTANNGFIYEATVAGTAAVGQPAWPTTVGGTVVDGGVTWTCRLKSLWVGSAVRAVGDMVRPTTPNGYIYRCTVAGTSAAAPEPTWPTTFGGTVVDGTVTWQCQSDPFAALAAGTDSLDLRYEVTADNLVTTKTVAIIPSSTLRIKRREQGA